MNHIRLISPVDGSLYAERPLIGSHQLEQVLHQAQEAQRAWRQLTLEQRAGYCLKAVDAMLAMKDEIVPELAWQMGRPVRFVGETADDALGERRLIGRGHRVSIVADVRRSRM